MSDAPVSRHKFLKSLGSSVTGMVLGSGVATAAHSLVNRIAAIGEGGMPPTSALPDKKRQEGEIHERGPVEGNRIALTFDDGPHPGVTDVILDALKKRNLIATFFMIGERIAAAPDLARRVLAEGHEVANHTYTHPRLSSLSDDQVAGEIQKTQQLFTEAMNHQATWLRPPFLAFRKNQVPLATKEGLRVVGGTDSRDWSKPGEDKILKAVFTDTKPGSIIICHDMHSQTANCMDALLDGLLERGFKFETVSSLLN